MEIQKSIEEFRREIMEELGSAVATGLTDKTLSLLLDQESDTVQLLDELEQSELYRAGLPVGAVRKLMKGKRKREKTYSKVLVTLLSGSEPVQILYEAITAAELKKTIASHGVVHVDTGSGPMHPDRLQMSVNMIVDLNTRAGLEERCSHGTAQPRISQRHLERIGHTRVRVLQTSLIRDRLGNKREVDAAAYSRDTAILVKCKSMARKGDEDQLLSLRDFIRTAELVDEGKELKKQHVLAFLCIQSLPKRVQERLQLYEQCLDNDIGIVMLSESSLTTNRALLQGHPPTRISRSHPPFVSGCLVDGSRGSHFATSKRPCCQLKDYRRAKSYRILDK